MKNNNMDTNMPSATYPDSRVANIGFLAGVMFMNQINFFCADIRIRGQNSYLGNK